MDIGLFGGSFNPPHVGHLWLAEQFRIKGKLDLIWVMVSPDPPHKDSVNMASYKHRLEMTRLMFAKSFGIELNEIEEELPKPGYTFQTVEALVSRHPGSSFWLCIGEDSLFNLPTWMEPDRLVRNVELLVARRGDYNPTSLSLPEEWHKKISYIDIVPRSTSSTAIREKVASRDSIEGLVTAEVGKYIVDHKLYLR